MRYTKKEILEGFLIAKKPSAKSWLRNLFSELITTEKNDGIWYDKDGHNYLLYNPRTQNLFYDGTELTSTLQSKFTILNRESSSDLSWR
jgi:hypothetical protein